jgi:hypothetical protein
MAECSALNLSTEMITKALPKITKMIKRLNQFIILTGETHPELLPLELTPKHTVFIT